MLPETRIMLVINKKKMNEYFSDVKLTNEIKIEFRYRNFKCLTYKSKYIHLQNRDLKIAHP